MQLSENKIFGSIVEEVQYREPSRGFVSHGLFVVRKVVVKNKRQRRSSKSGHKRQPYLQLSKNKIFASIVEEVQYRESSRFLVSHGLFVAYQVATENKRQRRSRKRSKGNHICNYLKIKSLAPLLKKYSIVNHQGV